MSKLVPSNASMSLCKGYRFLFPDISFKPQRSVTHTAFYAIKTTVYSLLASAMLDISGVYSNVVYKRAANTNKVQTPQVVRQGSTTYYIYP
jgi:hypothetical protein